MTTGSDRLKLELLDAAVELMGRHGRGGTVRVRGTSMVPTLHEGQLLAVEFSPERPARGDMLLFRQVDYLVVHRLLGPARYPDGRPCLRTRGDGLLNLDPHVDRSRVVGRVIAIEDGGGWRSVRGGPARLYGACLAWHDLFWAVMGVAGEIGERRLGKLRIRIPFRLWIGAIDRGLLRIVHFLFFRLVHRSIPKPAEAGEEAASPGSG